MKWTDIFIDFSWWDKVVDQFPYHDAIKMHVSVSGTPQMITGINTNGFFVNRYQNLSVFTPNQNFVDLKLPDRLPVFESVVYDYDLYIPHDFGETMSFTTTKYRNLSYMLFVNGDLRNDNRLLQECKMPTIDGHLFPSVILFQYPTIHFDNGVPVLLDAKKVLLYWMNCCNNLTVATREDAPSILMFQQFSMEKNGNVDYANPVLSNSFTTMLLSTQVMGRVIKLETFKKHEAFLQTVKYDPLTLEFFNDPITKMDYLLTFGKGDTP